MRGMYYNDVIEIDVIDERFEDGWATESSTVFR